MLLVDDLNPLTMTSATAADVEAISFNQPSEPPTNIAGMLFLLTVPPSAASRSSSAVPSDATNDCYESSKKAAAALDSVFGG